MVGGSPLAERSALSFPVSPLLCHIIRLHTHQRVCSSSSSSSVGLTVSLGLSDLHAPTVHLDNLGSEGLDSSQDQLLMLQGGDAKTQHIPAQTEIKGLKMEKKES